jgi:exosortase A-associated hydrolase 2
MNGASGVVRSGAYVAGSLGPLLRLEHAPAGRAPRGTVVAVHAFAEEMNKSRRMCARAARALAADGWRVVQTDLAGCGDSSGEFRDATWSAWVADLRSELADARTRGAVRLWCHRAGALLAAPVLAGQHDGVDLLLWQPVLSGAQHLQQFLRLHLGAQVVGSRTDGPGARQRLQAGETVELGGYELTPGLAAALEQSSFDLPEGFAGRVAWFELAPEAPAELPPAAARGLERLRSRGIAIDAQALAGPLFWQTQEIEDCPELVRRSVAALSTAPEAACHG